MTIMIFVFIFIIHHSKQMSYVQNINKDKVKISIRKSQTLLATHIHCWHSAAYYFYLTDTVAVDTLLLVRHWTTITFHTTHQAIQQLYIYCYVPRIYPCSGNCTALHQLPPQLVLSVICYLLFFSLSSVRNKNLPSSTCMVSRPISTVMLVASMRQFDLEQL